MKRTLLFVLSGIVLVGVLLLVGGVGREDYRAFDRQREDWHRRCDAYIGTPDHALNAAGRACAQELQELLAYAERKGWN